MTDITTTTIKDIVAGPDYTDDIKALADVFQAMDNAWEKVAAQYGFVCNGCEDNCCYATFYHHTLAEYLYLKQGLSGLPASVLQRVKKQALMAVNKTPGQEVICPLNEAGLCIVYPFRPMVCRLHGLAHELTRPGTDHCVRSPGCDFFQTVTADKAYVRFDRTLFYIKMADVEKTIRQKSGYNEKLKLTIADMVLK